MNHLAEKLTGCSGLIIRPKALLPFAIFPAFLALVSVQFHLQLARNPDRDLLFPFLAGLAGTFTGVIGIKLTLHDIRTCAKLFANGRKVIGEIVDFKPTGNAGETRVKVSLPNDDPPTFVSYVTRSKPPAKGEEVTLYTLGSGLTREAKYIEDRIRRQGSA